jgi:hypothetical protein
MATRTFSSSAREGAAVGSATTPVASGTAVEKNDKAVVDYSNTKDGVAVASGVGAGLGAQAESRESPKARAKRRLYRMVDVPFRFRFPIQSTILIHRCQERVTF